MKPIRPFFLIASYSGSEVWERSGINQTHLVALNFCLEKDYTTLPYLTIKHVLTVGANGLNCLD